MEVFSVLKPGGKLVLADTTCPARIFTKIGFYLYSRIIMVEGTIINKGYSFMVNSYSGKSSTIFQFFYLFVFII